MRKPALCALLLLPAGLARPDAPQRADCAAFGWTLLDVQDLEQGPDPYRLAVVYRLSPQGAVQTHPARAGLPLCPGDVLETWHGAQAQVVWGNNLGSAVAHGGSVLVFGERVVQRAGTATYLMPSGGGFEVDVLLASGLLRIDQARSTVQVSLSGPPCAPTVDVAVSALADPFAGLVQVEDPGQHGARLTVLDPRGSARGQPLELAGAQQARLDPGARQARLTTAGADLWEALHAVQARLRAPLAQRPPPTAEELVALAPAPVRLVVRAPTRPAQVQVNGQPWQAQGWSPGRRDAAGLRAWEASPPLALPPGPSVVAVTLPDGRRAVAERVVQPGQAVRWELVFAAGRAGAGPGGVEGAAPAADAPWPVPEGVGGPLGPPTVLTTTPGVDMAFVPLSGGVFQMGSPEGEGDGDEHPQHPVRVSAFALARHEVTQGQWAAVVQAGKAAGVKDARGLREDPSAFEGSPQLPVEQVSWCDAVRWANTLSVLEGRAPVYSVGSDCEQGGEVRWDREADGFRLPTEAEWEYAARAGTTTRYATGDAEADLRRLGWYRGNSGGQTREVCTQMVQPWGLCDMAGNVWEWVGDWYGAYTTGLELVPDPVGPESGVGRVVRGGSWNDVAYWARAAYRDLRHPSDTAALIGFRLAVAVPPQLEP